MPAKRSTTVRDRARAQLTKQQAACGICGQTINYQLPHTDPRSFVADHITPLYRGGRDALSNFQAAHRRLATATARRGRESSRRSCVVAAR